MTKNVESLPVNNSSGQTVPTDTVKTISRQTMNFINCLVSISNLCNDVYDAIEFVYGDQVDSLMNKKYNEKHNELKSVILEFLCDSIDDKLLDKDNEI